MSSTKNYIRVEQGRENDRSDVKWLHPLLRDQVMISSGISIKDWFDPNRTLEEKQELARTGVEPFVQFLKSRWIHRKYMRRGNGWIISSKRAARRSQTPRK